MNGKVLFDEDGWTRLLAEVPKVSLAFFPQILCYWCAPFFTVQMFYFYNFTDTILFGILQMKLVTPSGLVERLKINASLARAACKYLAEEGKINPVEVHHSQKIYTRVTA